MAAPVTSARDGSGVTGEHWDAVHRRSRDAERSWFEAVPETSLRLLAAAVPGHAGVVDVGGGDSRLAEALLAAGWHDVTVVDISAVALDAVRARLGARAAEVTLLRADVLTWVPDRRYTAWHDRAVFHFLSAPSDQDAYAAVAARAVAPGGVAVVATFAPDGPERCSGLPVQRYDSEGLAARFAGGFTLVAAERVEHRTPAGVVQPFTWVVLRRHGGEEF